MRATIIQRLPLLLASDVQQHNIVWDHGHTIKV